MNLLKHPLTVLVQSTVTVAGNKLKPGKMVKVDDSSFIRILVKAGSLGLIDPPSLDPEYLEKAGYEFREEIKPVETVVKDPNKNGSRMILPKKKDKRTSEEKIDAEYYQAHKDDPEEWG